MVGRLNVLIDFSLFSFVALRLLIWVRKLLMLRLGCLLVPLAHVYRMHIVSFTSGNARGVLEIELIVSETCFTVVRYRRDQVVVVVVVTFFEWRILCLLSLLSTSNLKWSELCVSWQLVNGLQLLIVSPHLLVFFNFLKIQFEIFLILLSKGRSIVLNDWVVVELLLIFFWVPEIHGRVTQLKAPLQTHIAKRIIAILCPRIYLRYVLDCAKLADAAQILKIGARPHLGSVRQESDTSAANNKIILLLSFDFLGHFTGLPSLLLGHGLLISGKSSLGARVQRCFQSFWGDGRGVAFWVFVVKEPCLNLRRRRLTLLDSMAVPLLLWIVPDGILVNIEPNQQAIHFIHHAVIGFIEMNLVGSVWLWVLGAAADAIYLR